MNNDHLPKPVRDQLEAAERIEAELAGTTPTVETPAPVQAPATPPETPPVVSETPAPTPQAPPAPVVTPEPAPTAPTPQPPVASTEADKTWEQRYRTLQGIHEADNRRHGTRITELERDLSASQAEVVRLKAAPPTPSAPAPAALTPKEIEEFGPELVDVINRVATTVADQKTASLQAQVTSLQSELTSTKDQVGGVATRQRSTDHSTFVTNLRGLVPDVDVVNADEGWKLWLAQTDPMVGVTRQALLDDAASRFDHDRAAAIVQRFKAETGYVAPAAPPPAAPQPPAAPVAPAPLAPPPLSVSPPTGSVPSAPPTPNSDQKVWSQAEITKYYEDVRKGVYSTNPAEAARIEAEIDLAVQSGRVTL